MNVKSKQTLKQSYFVRQRRREIAFSAFCFALLLGFIAVLPTMGDEEPLQTASVASATSGSAGAVNWGLSFPEPGQTPVGNASQDYLQQFDAYFVGDCNQKVIYLTFDAGYENGCTAQILDVLKKHQAPAAFFLVGSYIREHGDLVQRMAAEGHIVGNHTDTHPDMSAIADQEAFAAELAAVEAATARPICNRLNSWVIIRFFGAWLTLTGTPTINPAGRRLLASCCRECIMGRLCCCIVPRKPTPKFWMSF